MEDGQRFRNLVQSTLFPYPEEGPFGEVVRPHPSTIRSHNCPLSLSLLRRRRCDLTTGELRLRCPDTMELPSKMHMPMERKLFSHGSQTHLLRLWVVELHVC
jgi:hypothetical protein